jgi:hypothetical protein
MNKQNDSQFAEVQRLLAYKRADLPSEDYFHGLLFEFHQRQRASLLKPKSVFRWQQWTTDLIEAVSFQPTRALRYAMGLMLSIGLVGAGLNVTRLAPSLAVNAPVRSAIQYAFGDKPDSLESADHKIDSATLTLASFDSQAVRAHYVLNETAVQNESVPAF